MFTLAMEALTVLTDKGVKRKEVKLLNVGKPLNLSHLIFVDDLMLFVKAEKWTSQKALQILDLFVDLSNLKVHKLNSNIFTGGVHQGLRDELVEHSTGAYSIYLGYNLISWSSRKKPTVAHSSIEAEYKALSNAAVEIS
ncbi:hypothetical protein NE237_023813 [Protea cynaroides]|uniref:Reverse transcriptase n=1 Tax=Protea cynaroides TaxID=273540 RepID=A0A9Q0K4T7_9MAGN|nr:hypothetical protein NE237_023813 [Protea cynaroides]